MVTRKFLAFLIFALLSLGVTSCGGGNGEVTLPEDPQGMAEVAGFQGVHSGELEVALEIDRYKPGKPTEEVNMRLIGPFMGAGEGELPKIDMGIESAGPLGGREIDFNAALSLLKDQAVLTYGPQTYQPNKATFEELKSKFEEAQEEGGAAAVGACVEAAGDFNVAQVLHHVSYEGAGEALDGAKVKAVGADLDLSAAIGELIKLTEDPACEAQLEAVGVPPVPQLEQLEKQLKGSAAVARATISLDKHGVVHYLKVLTNVELPHNEELEIELVLRLNRVNEVTELPVPKGYAPFASLLKKFGVDMQTLEETDGNEVFLSFIEATAAGLFTGEKP